ncbi:SDR family oxidoreductase [Nocardia sp. NPDC058176]|uniref:SDR family oxidoreductase n=1 Tax=Nocardia sp. NPDC058176 TaxID=3346368 RepID=UPI0036DBBC91
MPDNVTRGHDIEPTLTAVDPADEYLNPESADSSWEGVLTGENSALQRTVDPDTQPGIDDFADRVAFVTGGSRGVGRGIVRALLRRGAIVAIADKYPEPIDLGEDADPTRLRSYQLDVSDREQYARVAAEVKRDLGEVTLLFNNAGIADSASPSRMSYQMWDHMLGVNLGGVYNGIQTFTPDMIESPRRCHIVNTASEAGLVAGGSGFLYTASKYGVVGLSESLRFELAHHGIGVSVLSPGPVATDIVENTRRLRPAEAGDHTARTGQMLDLVHEILHLHGLDPDLVGEYTVQAVESNAAYINTRNTTTELLRQRTDAIIAAMDHAQDFFETSATKV